MVKRSKVVEVTTRFDEIVNEYGRFLRQTITRLCPTDLGFQCDDLVQEAHLRLWRALESEREINDLASYIYRIAATTTIDALRRARVRKEEQYGGHEEGLDDGVAPLRRDSRQTPERIAEHLQIIEKVELALVRVAPDRRQAVRLHLEGMTSHEVADLMNWSEPKARNLIYRGLRDLRERLRAEGIEYEID